jgi:cyclomaltodextrinase
MVFCFIFLVMMTMQAQSPKPLKTLPFNEPPSWARDAIWYQIFVERFRNGNPGNNPTLTTCHNALIDKVPDDWELTPWGHNWYQQESWAKKTGLDFYRTIQMRRYGGDLAGVEEKIPYLVDLGINAIYFNPINDAPSLHKYDARHYHHIDVTFGNDAAGDMALMATEDHADPRTWKWTSADLKFMDLVRKLHENGIRVVLDFSWNHTGNNFWAFKDVVRNRQASRFVDWYHFNFYKDEKTSRDTFDYEGWIGIKNLPELRKVNTQGKIQGHPYEGNLQEEVKQHIFDVCRRWMDPHGDGSNRDGIDGMRLDVAEHVPMGFWREFRQYVRSINPEFYLVGENWWTKWPDELMDPAPWVKGDVFDAVMHYQWYKIARGYFAQSDDALNLNQFARKIDSVFLKYPARTQQAMMNLASSHDAPRLLTSFYNRNKYKFNCKPQENKAYKTNKPDEETYGRVKLLLLHQFTFVGSPHIWNGDEMGMFGADDPDNRKPLPWPDIAFDAETQSDFSSEPYAFTPSFDAEMHRYYKELIALRKSSSAFSSGTYELEQLSDPEKNIFAYTRKSASDSFMIVFNNNSATQSISLPLGIKVPVMAYWVGNVSQQSDQSNGITYRLAPFSAMVIRLK